jgi:DNA-binding transcriptional LysR family regulator
MRREDLADLAAFALIVEERSFTRAAARLGLSASALSHAMRALEERLGVKLLHRTTRSVAPTQAGERLLARLKPALGDIEAAVDELGTQRERPAGRVRISAHRMAAMMLVLPKLKRLRRDYPEVIVELTVDDGLTDIVSAGFDAGIRFRDRVALDMVSVQIGPRMRTAVVAAPSYFEIHPPPSSPQELMRHACIGYRFTTSGRIHRWEFEKDGQPLQVAVEAGFITNDAELLLQAALEGLGPAYVLEAQAGEHLASGALVRVLEEWCPSMDASFLYYPSRRQMPPALRVVVDALRHAPPAARG